MCQGCRWLSHPLDQPLRQVFMWFAIHVLFVASIGRTVTPLRLAKLLKIPV